MKRTNYKKIIRDINIPADKIFLESFREELSSFVYQRPIEKTSFFLLFSKRATVAGLFVLILASGGGLALASQSSLPGQWLYPVKIATENARLATTHKPEVKKRLRLEFIDRRIEEVAKIVKEKNPEDSAKKALTIIDQKIEEIEKEDASVNLKATTSQTFSSTTNQTIETPSDIATSTLRQQHENGNGKEKIKIQDNQVPKRFKVPFVQPKEIENSDLRTRVTKLRKSHTILEKLLNKDTQNENQLNSQDIKKEPELNQNIEKPREKTDQKIDNTDKDKIRETPNINPTINTKGSSRDKTESEQQERKSRSDQRNEKHGRN